MDGAPDAEGAPSARRRRGPPPGPALGKRERLTVINGIAFVRRSRGVRGDLYVRLTDQGNGGTAHAAGRRFRCRGLRQLPGPCGGAP